MHSTRTFSLILLKFNPFLWEKSPHFIPLRSSYWLKAGSLNIGSFDVFIKKMNRFARNRVKSYFLISKGFAISPVITNHYLHWSDCRIKLDWLDWFFHNFQILCCETVSSRVDNINQPIIRVGIPFRVDWISCSVFIKFLFLAFFFFSFLFFFSFFYLFFFFLLLFCSILSGFLPPLFSFFSICDPFRIFGSPSA